MKKKNVGNNSVKCEINVNSKTKQKLGNETKNGKSTGKLKPIHVQIRESPSTHQHTDSHRCTRPSRNISFKGLASLLFDKMKRFT